MSTPGSIYIIDDEEAIRDALVWLLASRDLSANAFASAEEFLEHIRTHPVPLPACLVLDVRMEAMSGLELFDNLRNAGIAPDMRVIFLTGHGNVPMAVESLKKGAFDFFEKPFNNNRLVDRIVEALEESRARMQTRVAQDQVRDRLASLTAREREVMDLIVAGKLNKIIADDLGISMRTVEVHRANIFAKMGARSAVDLVQLLKA